LRLARVGLHLASGVATVALAYPLLPGGAQRWLKQRWSGQLLTMLGIRAVVQGPRSKPRGLVVANHVSWLDIFVINALAPATFVCKADVRAWPVIGWLVAHTDTIFIERGSRAAAQRTSALIAARLARGDAIVVFPEGTSTDGSRLLEFKPALFQPAVEAGCTVRPLALRYVDRRGALSRAPAYHGDITLWQTLVALAASSGLRAELDTRLPEFPAGGLQRRELAQAARAAIGRALTCASPGPAVPSSEPHAPAEDLLTVSG
jgi:1-acyl-sn-glycerol-3-phosphate acyltransferase